MTDSTITIPVIAVYGTKGGDFDDTVEQCKDDEHWWHAFSKWWTYFSTLGEPTLQFVPFRKDRDFSWSGALDGPLDAFWAWIRGNKSNAEHREWRAGGAYLDDYCAVGVNAGRDPNRFLVVAHSHGGQVALYGAAGGRHLPILITVSTPQRWDMHGVIVRARPHIGFWVHLYDPDGDLVAQEGMFGDGSVSFDRTFKEADVNVPLKGCSHSGALRDPSLYYVWKDAVLPVIREQLAGWAEVKG